MDSKEFNVTARGQSLRVFSPEQLVVIGDPKHPRYDYRVESEPSEEFILNVMEQGVITPIVVGRDDDGDPLVIDGRKRWQAAKAANVMLRKAGKATLMLNCIYHQLKDDEHFWRIRHSAQLHTPEALSKRAEYAVAHMQRFSWTPARTGTYFGVGEATIRQWMALMECIPAVRAAVDGGGLGLANAVKISKFTKNEQPAELAKVREAKTEATGGRGGGAKTQHVGIPRSKARKLLTYLTDGETAAAEVIGKPGLMLARIILGEVTAEEGGRQIRGLTEALREVGVIE